VSPTLNVNPTLFVIPRKTLGRLLDLQRCKNCHLPSDFFTQISIIHDNISSQVVDKRRQSFGQWMNSSIMHDDIYSTYS
jgi:hypothetical protein